MNLSPPGIQSNLRSGGFIMALVLVVDDDQELVNLIKKYLADEGHQIMNAANPIDALELMQKYRFSLAIVDVNMPHQSGFEFVEQLRRTLRHRLLPVIFITARSEKKDIDRARKLDIIGYIIKPLEQTTFVEKIRSVMERVKTAAPDYNAVDITKENIVGNLLIPYSMQIESVSEVGLTILTPHDIGDLEKNPNKQIDIQSNIWAFLDIQPTNFKIGGKQWIEEIKQFRYTLFYIKVNQEDLDKLKKWVERPPIKK